MKSPLLALLLSTTAALAHHGQDFFVTLDASPPAKKSFTAFATFSASHSSRTLESGILAGLGAGWAAGFTTGIDPDNHFQATSITPSLLWSLPLGTSPLRLGLSLTHHFHDSSRTTHTAGHGGHSHGGHSHRRSTTASPLVPATAFASFGAAFNPDAPPPPIPNPAPEPTNASSTIHLHEVDYSSARLILECELSRDTRILGNLILAGTSRQDTAIGYAFALRHSLNPAWALGFEATGDFQSTGYHEIIASLIHNPNHSLSLRTGLSHGLGPAAAPATGLFGITWRF